MARAGIELNERQALIFAAVLGTTAMAMLAFLVNLLTAVLTFASLIGYAVVILEVYAMVLDELGNACG